MDYSSSKPFFITLLAGGALLLAGIAIGVVGTRTRGWIRSSALTAVRTKCASALRNSCTGWRSFHVLKALGNTSSNPSPAQLFINRESER